MTPQELKELREAYSLSQAEFGEKLNIHQSAVSQYETGKIAIPGYVESLIRCEFKGVDPPPKKEPLKIDGAKIREIRKRYQLRRRQFGNVIGRSESAVTRYENGERTPPEDVVKKILEMDKPKGGKDDM